MRSLQIFCCLFSLFFVAACHSGPKTPEEASKAVLEEALEALQAGDYDVYLEHVDFGVSLDSLQMASMKSVLLQHQEWKRAERAEVLAVEVIDVHLLNDSVCTAHYQYVFADSTKEVVSQKMVRCGEDWKIRVRN